MKKQVEHDIAELDREMENLMQIINSSPGETVADAFVRFFLHLLLVVSQHRIDITSGVDPRYHILSNLSERSRTC